MMDKLREAGPGDIDCIAAGHVKMFAEMMDRLGDVLAPATARQIHESMRAKLMVEMPAKTCRAWVIENDCQTVSIGALSILSLVPSPYEPSCRTGYIHSMYTEPDHRLRGYGRRILESILDFCGSADLRRITLNASDQGIGLYRGLGFEPVKEHMQYAPSKQRPIRYTSRTRRHSHER